MKGVQIFGWSTIFLPFLLFLVDGFSKAPGSVSASKIFALGVGAAVMVLLGVGLLKRITVARTAFLIYTFLLFLTLLGGLIHRSMPPVEFLTAVGGVVYGVSGFWYFIRPSVKAYFRSGS